ncbi:hypothetical protein FB446DRAFT_699997 [Lentinula raphanica]|nr:hypothetical protein FB446DRAFT_699997 [Lentinula raphanica]
MGHRQSSFWSSKLNIDNGTKARSLLLLKASAIEEHQPVIMPPKSHPKRRNQAAKQRRQLLSPAYSALTAHSPNAGYDLTTATSSASSQQNETEEPPTGEEKAQMLAHLHDILQETITQRSVPFPLHVAFAEDVPPEQKGVAPPRGPGSTIGFWEWEGERYRWGIPLSQLAEDNSKVANPDEMIFDSNSRELSFQGSLPRFELVWPGYLHQRWLISIPLSTTAGEQIRWTKKNLGKFIACQYRNFAQSCSRPDIICKEPAWRIGPGGITFEDMRIVTFWNLTKDIWRAEITVEVSSHGWARSQQEYYSLTGAEGCYKRIIPEEEDKKCPSCGIIHDETTTRRDRAVDQLTEGPSSIVVLSSSDRAAVFQR